MANNFINGLPSAWADADQIEGLDLVEKASLVGVPFLITGVHFTINDKDISYVWVDAENAAGEQFSFNDSSSGVRQQVVEYLTKIGKSDIVETEEYVSVRLVCAKGLRVSEYDAERPNPRTGKNEWIRARTYRLTTTGKREQAPAPAAAAKRARQSAPKPE